MFNSSLLFGSRYPCYLHWGIWLVYVVILKLCLAFTIQCQKQRFSLSKSKILLDLASTIWTDNNQRNFLPKVISEGFLSDETIPKVDTWLLNVNLVWIFCGYINNCKMKKKRQNPCKTFAIICSPQVSVLTLLPVPRCWYLPPTACCEVREQSFQINLLLDIDYWCHSNQIYGALMGLGRREGGVKRGEGNVDIRREVRQERAWILSILNYLSLWKWES